MTAVFRHAAYDTPWWVSPNRSPARWHRAGDGPTQYWSLHPAGPSAEALRAGLPSESRITLWIATVDLDDVLRVHFDTADEYGVTAGELVSENLTACQDLGARLRNDGVSGIVAPSAALTGVDNLILFGARVAVNHHQIPTIGPQVPTAKALVGPPLAAIAPLVRQAGQVHHGFERWAATGEVVGFDDLAVDLS